MIDESTLSCFFDRIVPPERALADVRRVLFTDRTRVSVEVSDDKDVCIPEDCAIDVVSRGLYQRYYGSSFPFWIQLAIGGVIKSPNRDVEARYCFATLYYNLDGEMITLDFDDVVDL